VSAKIRALLHVIGRWVYSSLPS